MKDYIIYNTNLWSDPETRREKLNKLSLDELMAEYERVCIAQNSLWETAFFIENLGWFRDEDGSRATKYTDIAHEYFSQETYYKTRANARPNICTILEDMKNLMLGIGYYNFGHIANERATEINKKYNELHKQFFDANKDNQ
jgi:hypothetical protein